MDDDQFAWILWYNCKGKNNKAFSNLDINPRNTLKLAETKSIFWTEAQVLNIQRGTRPVEAMTMSPILG